jgi:hypothetical protein
MRAHSPAYAAGRDLIFVEERSIDVGEVLSFSRGIARPIKRSIARTWSTSSAVKIVNASPTFCARPVRPIGGRNPQDAAARRS